MFVCVSPVVCQLLSLFLFGSRWILVFRSSGAAANRFAIESSLPVSTNRSNYVSYLGSLCHLFVGENADKVFTTRSSRV